MDPESTSQEPGAAPSHTCREEARPGQTCTLVKGQVAAERVCPWQKGDRRFQMPLDFQE